MKSALIFGVASAHIPYVSLAESDAHTPQAMNAGVCQVFEGTIMFDLMKFDSIGSKEHPNSLSQHDGVDFQYKVCQQYWAASDIADFQNTGEDYNCGTGNNMAYLGEDGVCVDRFDLPTFLPIVNNDEDTKEDTPYLGFTLKYTTNDEDETKRTVTIDAFCDAAATDDVFTDATGANESNDFQFKYTGPKACQMTELDPTKIFPGVLKFIGAISIILGLVLTFYGSKFLVTVFGLLVFLLTQVIMWGILYNTHMFKPEHVETKKGQIIAIGVVLFGLGGVIAYFSAKFADKFAVSLIAGWCGGIFGFMVVGATTIPPLAQTFIVLAIAAAAAYYSFKVKRYIKSGGTAIIGAFILFNGIGKYAGGYPSFNSGHSDDETSAQKALEEMSDEQKGMALFYLAGTIAFAVLGTWVQLTYVEKKEEDNEDFMKAEDS